MFCLISWQTSIAQPYDTIKDPLYPQQWHLKNSGQRGGSVGEDINVESVWPRYKGEGTYIAIVDGDLQLDHPDLVANLSTQHTVDYYPDKVDLSSHATSVAGTAAARDNELYGRGVAPRAQMFSLNLLGDSSSGFSRITTEDLVDALTRHSSMTAVYNNSWGSGEPFTPIGTDLRIWELAIEHGISEGFHGAGSVYVFAAGNNHCSNRRVLSDTNGYEFATVCGVDNSNYEGHTNYHAVIAVCSVGDRGYHNGEAEFGANLWLCAPSQNAEKRNGIVTLSRPSTHTATFSGTSASAPIVSGVVALMRQANPTLSWRDVKLILAHSARQNHTTDSSWHTGSARYGTFKDDAMPYHFSHRYGFGVVDAQRAVDLSENWINLPPRAANTETKLEDTRTLVGNRITTSSVSIQSPIDFIEYVEVLVAFEHPVVHDLSIRLKSPAAAISELAIPSSRAIEGTFSGIWRFGTARHLGEDPSGIWTLLFADTRSAQNRGRLIDWKIRIRGYPIKMTTTTATHLRESNIERETLTLALSGARWKQNLTKHDFYLKDAPPGLSIAQLSRTSDTQVRLRFTLDAGFASDYRFRVGATTGTVSNLSRNLLSGGIALYTEQPPVVVKAVVPPVAEVGLAYRFTIDTDTFGSSATLRYLIGGDTIPGLTISNLSIGGTPTTVGPYRLTVTATTRAGNSTATSFILRVMPRAELSASSAVALSGSNINGSQIMLNLSHARWSDALLPLYFKLREAPPELYISRVSRASDTQAQLTLSRHNSFRGDYHFRIEATTDAISNFHRNLISNELPLHALSKFRVKVYLESALE